MEKKAFQNSFNYLYSLDAIYNMYSSYTKTEILGAWKTMARWYFFSWILKQLQGTEKYIYDEGKRWFICS